MAVSEDFVLEELREIRRGMREDAKETREAMDSLRSDLTDTRDCVQSWACRVIALEAARTSRPPPLPTTELAEVPASNRSSKAKTIAVTIGGAGGLGTALVWLIKQLTGS